MPKIPDDMSAAAEKKREAMTLAYKAKPSIAEPPPPKPRIAKKR